MVAKRWPAQGDVYLVSLDPVQGRQLRKTRPCLIVSPDELNEFLSTVTVAPMTTGGYRASWRVPCRFKRKDGFVAVDQIRTVDSTRLVKKLGALDAGATSKSLAVLAEMFAR